MNSELRLELGEEINGLRAEMHKQHNRLLAELSAVIGVATAFLHFAS